jgi:hypothetical protein
MLVYSQHLGHRRLSIICRINFILILMPTPRTLNPQVPIHPLLHHSAVSWLLAISKTSMLSKQNPCLPSPAICPLLFTAKLHGPYREWSEDSYFGLTVLFVKSSYFLGCIFSSQLIPIFLNRRYNYVYFCLVTAWEPWKSCSKAHPWINFSWGIFSDMQLKTGWWLWHQMVLSDLNAIKYNLKHSERTLTSYK